MKLYLNGESFDVTIYDTSDTILEKYSYSKEGSLPSFFRIEGDYIVEDDAHIVIKDIRDVLKDMPKEDFLNEANIKVLLNLYTNMNKENIGILWARMHLVQEAFDNDIMRQFSRIDFPTPNVSISKIYEEYPKELKRQHNQLRESIDKQKQIALALEKVNSIPVEPFKPDEITTQIILRLPDDDAPIDVFNALNVSREIPYIFLKFEGKTYYKVYKYLTPLRKWYDIDISLLDEGIYFKILNTTNRIESKQVLLNTIYSDGFWDIRNQVQITYKAFSTVNDVMMKRKLESALENRLKYEVISQKQLNIKGKFTVNDFTLNRAIFVDLAETNSIISYFIYFNERTVTATKKERFAMYYEPNQRADNTNALTITVTPFIEDNMHNLAIRVTQIPNLHQANAFRIVFSQLLAIYEEEKNQIISYYSQYIPKFKTLADVSGKKKQKKEKKTGKRADKLRNQFPEIFMKRYADRCFQKQQPYWLNTEDAQKLATKLGQHKVMNWPLNSDNWYACQPREADDSSDAYIWPGLKKNTKLPNLDQYPYLPCCFEEDQYEKRASKLRRYLEGEGEQEEQEELFLNDLGYIKKTGKRVGIGKYGMGPFYLERIMELANIPKFDWKKESYSPILRYGMRESPDSFIHCLELVFNPEYLDMSLNDREARVMEVKRNLSQLPSEIGKQELFRFNRNDLIAYLNTPDSYISPEVFVELLEFYYRCNIILMVEDKDHPYGDIVLPKTTNVYLTRKMDETLPLVLILKSTIAFRDYPYICTPMPYIKADARHQVTDIQFAITDREIVSIFVKLFQEINKIYSVSIDNGTKEYNPLSIKI
jgi:hypothetical protein